LLGELTLSTDASDEATLSLLLQFWVDHSFVHASSAKKSEVGSAFVEFVILDITVGVSVDAEDTCL